MTREEETLTPEWDGHFLFKQRNKKDVRVFIGVFPFIVFFFFFLILSKLLILLLKYCFCVAVVFPGTTPNSQLSCQTLMFNASAQVQRSISNIRFGTINAE